MCRFPIRPPCWARLVRALVHMFVGDSNDHDPAADYIYF
jgi:hypothetical protein